MKKTSFKKRNLRAVELGGNKFKEACSQEAPPSFLHYIIYYIFSNFFQAFFLHHHCTLRGTPELPKLQKNTIGGFKNGAIKQLRCGSGNFSFSY